MLGVVTEITLSLLPLPPARATLSAAFGAMSDAATAVQADFCGGLSCRRRWRLRTVLRLEAARHELGQALVPPGNAHLLVEVDGQEESVESEAAGIENLIRSMSPNSLEIAKGDAESEKLWALRREFSNSLRATGLTKLNQDVVVPRSRIVDLVDFAAELQKKSGFPIACFGHAGDGNVHVNIMAANYQDPEVRQKVGKACSINCSHKCWRGVVSLPASTASDSPRSAGGRKRPVKACAGCIAR